MTLQGSQPHAQASLAAPCGGSAILPSCSWPPGGRGGFPLLCAQVGTSQGWGGRMGRCLSFSWFLFLVSLPRPRSAVTGCHTRAFSEGRVRNRLWLPQFQAAPAYYPQQQLLNQEGADRVGRAGESLRVLTLPTPPEAPPLPSRSSSPAFPRLLPSPGSAPPFLRSRLLPPKRSQLGAMSSPVPESPLLLRLQGCFSSTLPGPHQERVTRREGNRRPWFCALFRPGMFVCARLWGLHEE